jgi:hypothetical protein
MRVASINHETLALIGVLKIGSGSPQRLFEAVERGEHRLAVGDVTRQAPRLRLRQALHHNRELAQRKGPKGSRRRVRLEAGGASGSKGVAMLNRRRMLAAALVAMACPVCGAFAQPATPSRPPMPPPRQEVRPRRPPGPRRWHWSRGRWRWNRRRWVWTSGSWR